MTKRRSLSTKDRVAIFTRSDGICHICKIRIRPREKWQVEHSTPFAIGGSDRVEDLLPVHVACHADKTKRDLKEIAKSKRIHAKHIGAWRSKSPPMPGTKRSGWKRLFSGKVERRT